MAANGEIGDGAGDDGAVEVLALRLWTVPCL